MSIVDPLLDLLFPTFCIRCGMFGSYLCGRCIRLVPRTDLPLCPGCMGGINELGVHQRCGRKTALDGLLALTSFSGEVKKLIVDAKYHGYFAMIPSLADFCLYAIAKDHQRSLKVASPRALVPIPLSKERLEERGFNQSQVLCTHLSRQLRIPTTEKLVTKVHTTLSQAQLRRKDRQKNLEGVFDCTTRLRKSDTILLIDDVVTTGTTLSAVAKALKKAGCGKVYGLAIAHGH